MKDRSEWYKNAQVFFLAVFMGTKVANVLQFYLVHTPYLTSRTALFFYPLLAINCILFTEWVRVHIPSSQFFFTLPLSVVGLMHLSRSANFNHCFEWWYDADTYKVMNYLESEHHKTNLPLTLNWSWWFFPSLNFHSVTENKD